MPQGVLVALGSNCRHLGDDALGSEIAVIGVMDIECLVVVRG